MKKLLLLALCHFLLLAAHVVAPPIVTGQETITAADAANSVGKRATVCDMVESVHYAPGKGQPIFLDLGRAYPRQLVSVHIRGSDRGKFERPPDETFAGKEICVTGVIQSYRGRLEIIVKEPLQIRVK